MDNLPLTRTPDRPKLTWAVGKVSARLCSTHGQPVSDPVRVAEPRAGSKPRLTGDEPVVTLAYNSSPASDCDGTATVTRIASPVSTIGGAARACSRAAKAAAFRAGSPPTQEATLANRAGSTASVY